jgi:hypothetical protein
VRKFLFHCLKSVFGPMVGTVIFMDILVKAGRLVNGTTDDH